MKQDPTLSSLTNQTSKRAFRRIKWALVYTIICIYLAGPSLKAAQAQALSDSPISYTQMAPPDQAVSRFGNVPMDKALRDSDDPSQRPFAGQMLGSSFSNREPGSLLRARPQEETEEVFAAPERSSRPSLEATLRAPASIGPVGSGKNLRLPKLAQGLQEVAIVVHDLGYFPEHIRLYKGVPAKIFVTSVSKNPLCMVVDAFGIKKQVRFSQVEEINFTPDQAGIFKISCPVGPIEGKVIVLESPDSPIVSSPTANLGQVDLH